MKDPDVLYNMLKNLLAQIKVGSLAQGPYAQDKKTTWKI